METQCQRLKMTQRNEFITILQWFEELFYGTLDTWETDLLDFELKEDEDPICSQPCPVLRLHEEFFKSRLYV